MRPGRCPRQRIPALGCCGLLLGTVGLPFCRGRDLRPASAAMVYPFWPPGRGRPLFPLRRKQLRQHARLAGLPCRDRAESPPSPAERRLGRGYGVFVALTLACVIIVWKGQHGASVVLESLVPTRGPGPAAWCPSSPLDLPGVRPVQPDAGRYDVLDDRYRGHPALVGDPAGALSAHIHPDLRADGPSFPTPG